MKNKKQKKSGFTLVELMVVAIIVAILAAVAIPLMSGNRERAMKTEAQAGCSTIANGIKMQWVETGSFSTNTAPATLPGIGAKDLEGTYYRQADYSFTATDGQNYNIKASGSGDAAGVDVEMDVVDGKATWK